MSSKKTTGKFERSDPPTARKKPWAAIFLFSVGLLLSLAIFIWLRVSANDKVATPVLSNTNVLNVANSDKPVRTPVPATAMLPSREATHKNLVQQLEEVDHTLCSYRESSKYPLSSRPISEHPDQVYPNLAVKESHAIRNKDGSSNSSIQISTSQSRVYMAARESVNFSIQALDKDQQMLPVFVNRAVASGLNFNNHPAPTQIPMALADNGRDGDLIPNDGIAGGTLNPGSNGFAGFNGTIRTEVNFTVNGQAGVVYFDVIYSPELPAVWAGKIREVIENGSLVFYLPIDVQQAGRYIVNARLDDAKAAPFALLNFNEVLPLGRSEIRLSAAGNLLRDNQATFPMSLRDIDGYLLKENVDPDRALIARMQGVAHVSKNYTLKSFSDAEWNGEERTRHLKEFAKDVELAKAALVAFDPEQAQRPFPRSECSMKGTKSLARL
jgi:hypothetical protein